MATGKKYYARPSYRFLSSGLPQKESSSPFELDESDFYNSAEFTRKPAVTVSDSRIGKKQAKCTDSGGGTPASLPVNVPDWSKILKDEYRDNRRSAAAVDNDYDDDVYGEDGVRVPPHEFLARTGIVSFSVHEGVGRTLKGGAFARSIAQIASIHLDRCQKYKSKDQKGHPRYSEGKHTQEEKSDLSESSDEGSEGIVQADFVFFDPKPDDFHGVKVLLQTYLDDTQWDLSGFADLILAQTTVGTVVKIEGDDDDTPFSIVTALNLGRYQDHKCIMELKEFLLKACRVKDVINDLRLLTGEQARNVGLLVSQRVVNLPPQLLPPLYDALFDEVSWATEDEPTEELRNSFRFKCYLLVSKIYKHKNAIQKKNANGSGSDEEIVYIKPEDEIFHKLSSWSFCFPMHTQQVETQELKNYRLAGLVMAVEAAKISTFRQQLQYLIVES